MYENIPLEMRILPRWCLTGTDADGQMEKAPHYFNRDKHRYEAISVHDVEKLSTLDEVLPYVTDRRGFGFVLVDGDGFTCLDLDVKENAPVSATERQINLVQGLDTYTEVSRSGMGLHLWLRGEIEGALKTNELEVYSRERFIICTGNVVNDKPVVYDESVLNFFNSKASVNAESFNLADKAQTKTDEKIIQEATDGDHSGKFAALMSGDWGLYERIMQSQGAYDFTFDASQADSAFMTIITFYTRNIDQCKRLWRLSALADVTKRYPNSEAEQRKKARNVGTEYKLNRAIAYGVQKNERDAAERERLAQEGDEASKKILAKAQERVEYEFDSFQRDTIDRLEYPPGMMGELARYFEEQSIKPVREFAIAEALSVAAGLFGRTYNISRTGLNIYLMMLAPSGSGKSSLSKNPENLMTSLERKHGVVGAKQFITTKRFTHENSMFQEFRERSQFTQCLSEFGKIFKNMVAESNTGGALATVREAMTDVFSKSGYGDSVGGMRYSTVEKSIDLSYPVAYSFLGESVPEPFFESITPDMFTDGFMSRFLIMMYDGEVPYDNQFLVQTDPPEHLLNHLIQCATGAIKALMDINSVEVMPVGADAEAGKWFSDFSRTCTDKINKLRDDSLGASLWNRANLKVLKVAGLLAVMDCPMQPIVNMSHVNWAYDFVMKHNHLVVNAVKQGRMSSATESETIATIRDIMLGFHKVKGNLTAYHPKAAEMQPAGHIPWGYIRHVASRRAAFKSNKWKKPAQLVRETMEELKRSGIVRQLSTSETTEKYGSTADVYQIVG